MAVAGWFAVLSRLKTRADFLRVSAAKRKAAMPGLVLQVAPRPAVDGGEGPRVGLTVSRKVGNAVTRNRARRRLRDAAESVLAGWGRPDLDYVLIGRQDTPSRPFARLVEDLRRAVRRVDAVRADAVPPQNRD